MMGADLRVLASGKVGLRRWDPGALAGQDWLL